MRITMETLCSLMTTSIMVEFSTMCGNAVYLSKMGLIPFRRDIRYSYRAPNMQWIYAPVTKYPAGHDDGYWDITPRVTHVPRISRDAPWSKARGQKLRPPKVHHQGRKGQATLTHNSCTFSQRAFHHTVLSGIYLSPTRRNQEHHCAQLELPT